MLKKGTFRKDLFYRLNIFHVRVPNLEEMQEDIPRLAYYFVSELRGKKRRTPNRISPDAMVFIKRYPWPGNVRELRNTVERAMHISEGNQITIDDLPNRIREFYKDTGFIAGDLGLLRHIVENAEKRAIIEALRLSGGNKARAAKMLGIHRTGLYQKLKRYQLPV